MPTISGTLRFLGTQSQTGPAHRRQNRDGRRSRMASDERPPGPVSEGQLAFHQPEQSVSDDGGIRRVPVAHVL